MFSDKAIALESMLNGYLQTCNTAQALECKQVLIKIISNIENGNQSKTGKRQYNRITNETLGRIKDYVMENPDAKNTEIEIACGLGTNYIATCKRDVLENTSLADYVNLCRIDPELLKKRKSVLID